MSRLTLPAPAQAGFTLVELMVSLALGLFVVLALLLTMSNMQQHNSEMLKTHNLIENGRLAMQLLQEDVAHAGYWGGHVPQFDDLITTTAPADVPTAVPDPCLAYEASTWTPQHQANLLGIPVQGYDIPDTVPSPTLAVCAGLVIRPQVKTDVLFVRHAEACVPGEGACPAAVNGELYFQFGRCGSTAVVPDYLMSNTLAAFTLQNRDCSTLASIRRFVSNLYYIRDYAASVGDGVPTLMRSQFGVVGGVPQHKAAEPMVEGIEGFRVEYGMDNMSDAGTPINLAAAINWANPSNKTSPTNRGDGVPDGSFVRCTSSAPCTVDQLTNVVVARIHVLARSDKPTPSHLDTKTYTLGSTTLGPFNDHFKRHVFTQTIRLVNVSSRRETPP